MQHASDGELGGRALPRAPVEQAQDSGRDPSETATDAAASAGQPALGLPGVVRLNEASLEVEEGDYDTEAGTASTYGALRLAAALLGYGLPVFRVEEALGRLTSAMGTGVRSLGLPRALVVTVPGLVSERTVFVPAEEGFVDLDRLSSLHDLVGQVERGELRAAAVDDEVDRVLDAPPHYANPFVVMACALSGWGAACVLGGSLLDAHAAGFVGLLVGALLWANARHRSLSLMQPMLAGLLVGFTSTLAASLFAVQSTVIIAASLIPLLPGLSITVAMMELGAGHSLCGTSRFANSAAVLLQLGFGGLVGARLEGALWMPSELPSKAALPPELLWLGAFVMTLGIAVLLQVRRRDIGWVLAISATAFAVSRVTNQPYGPAAGALLSSVLVGVLSNLFARRFDRPASVLQVPGILMLVPGCLGLSSLSGLIGTNPVGALESAGQVLLIATALSLGVLISTTLLPARSSL